LVNLYKGGTPGKGTLPNSENLSVEDIHCGGCLSDDLFMYCRQCEIRACTKEKGYTGCHECDDFPCQYIDNFSMAVGKKSFCGLSRIEGNSELKNGFETKMPVIYVQNAAIRFFAAR